MNETLDKSYESILAAGKEMEQNALAMQKVARGALGIVDEPTARLELTEDEMMFLSEELSSVYGTSEVADDLHSKVRQAIKIETNPGGIWDS